MLPGNEEDQNRDEQIKFSFGKTLERDLGIVNKLSNAKNCFYCVPSDYLTKYQF